MLCASRALVLDFDFGANGEAALHEAPADGLAQLPQISRRLGPKGAREKRSWRLF